MGLVERLKRAELLGPHIGRVSNEEKAKVGRVLVNHVKEVGLTTGEEVAIAVLQVLDADLSDTSRGRIQRAQIKSRYIFNNPCLRKDYLEEYDIRVVKLFDAIHAHLRQHVPKEFGVAVSFHGVPHGQKVYYENERELQEYLAKRLTLKTPVIRYDFLRQKPN